MYVEPLTALCHRMAYCKFAQPFTWSGDTACERFTRYRTWHAVDLLIHPFQQVKHQAALRHASSSVLARTRGVRQHEALALVAGGQQHACLADRHTHAHRVHLHPRNPFVYLFFINYHPWLAASRMHAHRPAHAVKP